VSNAMPSSFKERITSDLEKAKSEGRTRSEHIREIFRTAISQAMGEIKAGSNEIQDVVRDAIAALLETSREKRDDLKDNVTASMEGLVEGISQAKRDEIAKTEAEIQQLQVQIQAEEKDLQNTVNDALAEVEKVSQESPSDPDFQDMVRNIIQAIQNSEEVELLQKRYAQLQAQLAIARANLAARYGERYEEVKKYIDAAQSWNERAKDQLDKTTVAPLQKKQAELEAKIGEVGTAVAQKEKRIKELLKELWHTVTEG
jgi:hypothetical protein